MESISLGGMNIVDIIILIIIFLSVMIGFSRGLISEVVSLGTLIAAFAIAIMFTNPLAAYFSSTATVQGVVSETTNAIGASTAQPISYVTIGISFTILFVVTLIIGAFIKMALNLMFQTGILGFGNRVLGGAFGFVRGLLLTLVMIFLVQLSPLAQQPWWQQSKYVPYFQSQVVWLGSIVSPALANLKSTFGSTIQDATGAVKNMTGGGG
jgi:membrane protein required for colicin V production